MKKIILQSAFLMLVACILKSCVFAVVPYSLEKDLIGTWELTQRASYHPGLTDVEKIYPGKKSNPSELTFYHDGEFTNLYDGDRTGNGKFATGGQMIKMKSYDGVHWGYVYISIVTQSELTIYYCVYPASISESEFQNPNNWEDFKGFDPDALFYRDKYKRIKSGN